MLRNLLYHSLLFFYKNLISYISDHLPCFHSYFYHLDFFARYYHFLLLLLLLVVHYFPHFDYFLFYLHYFYYYHFLYFLYLLYFLYFLCFLHFYLYFELLTLNLSYIYLNKLTWIIIRI